MTQPLILSFGNHVVPFILIVKLHGFGKNRAAMYNDSYVSAFLYSALAVAVVYLGTLQSY